ncbi:MAG: hypothetical protein JXA42_26955 [Anaerolineales bacterium]|nr:hypothetical protein [Anaerolineales bacterium]
MSNHEEKFYPLLALERASKPILRVFAVLLIAASLWGIVNQITLWGKPVQLSQGIVGKVKEQAGEDGVHYSATFTLQESGQEIEIQLRNNSPVLEYLSNNQPTEAIALRYWRDNLMAFELHTLEYGVASIKDPVPPSFVLVGSSILGFLLAGVLLFPEVLDRMFYHVGRGTRRRKRAG